MISDFLYSLHIYIPFLCKTVSAKSCYGHCAIEVLCINIITIIKRFLYISERQDDAPGEAGPAGRDDEQFVQGDQRHGQRTRLQRGRQPGSGIHSL